MGPFSDHFLHKVHQICQPTHHCPLRRIVDGNPARFARRRTRSRWSSLRLQHFGFWFSQTSSNGNGLRFLSDLLNHLTSTTSETNRDGKPRLPVFLNRPGPPKRPTWPRRQTERLLTQRLLGIVVPSTGPDKESRPPSLFQINRSNNADWTEWIFEKKKKILSLLSVIATYNNEMFNFAQSDNIACYTENIWQKQISDRLRKWIGSALQNFKCYWPYSKCFSGVCLSIGRTEWNQGFQWTHSVLCPGIRAFKITQG